MHSFIVGEQSPKPKRLDVMIRFDRCICTEQSQRRNSIGKIQNQRRSTAVIVGAGGLPLKCRSIIRAPIIDFESSAIGLLRGV